ncbi:MAG: D-2-hydroxyacid dehydrogenase [Oscillospiraceae bacterium]|nr:D-2-hydroxyacid dehydrogenase [Oscillospiraceae bacterium]
MKIVMLEAATVSKNDVSFEDIYRLGEVREYPLTPVDKITEYVGDAEAVLCNKTPFTSEVMEECPNLKYIGLCATGFNNIDIDAANRLGITVCNVPAYSDSAVAQQVFSFILHFSNRVGEYDGFVHDGGWVRSETFSAFDFPTTELEGKNLGIIGYGRIGHAAAKIARAFGMNVIVNTRTAKQDNTVKFVSFEQLLSESDFITLHCPLTPETNGLINMDVLKKCKPSAVLINTSRGAVVNEADLAAALNGGIIAGAGLDVLCEEPMNPANPLLTAKNCVITPHVAWAPIDTRRRLMKAAAANLSAYINGNPINTVN